MPPKLIASKCTNCTKTPSTTLSLQKIEKHMEFKMCSPKGKERNALVAFIVLNDALYTTSNDAHLLKNNQKVTIKKVVRPANCCMSKNTLCHHFVIMKPAQFLANSFVTLQGKMPKLLILSKTAPWGWYNLSVICESLDARCMLPCKVKSFFFVFHCFLKLRVVVLPC